MPKLFKLRHGGADRQCVSDLDSGPVVTAACPACSARLRGTPQWCPRCYADLRPVPASVEPVAESDTSLEDAAVRDTAAHRPLDDPGDPAPTDLDPSDPDPAEPEVTRLLESLAEEEAARRLRVGSGGPLASLPPAALAGAGGLVLAILSLLVLSGLGAVLSAR